MTPRQIIKELTEAGISLEGLKIENRDEIEIYFVDQYGDTDTDKVDAKHTEIIISLPEFGGGFYTGYKSFIAQRGYVSLGDWNDKSSSSHY